MEEVGSNAIVFAGNCGSLYRLDLESGELRELIKLPGDAWVIDLEMAADGSTLGVKVGTMLFSEAAQSTENANGRGKCGPIRGCVNGSKLWP